MIITAEDLAQIGPLRYCGHCGEVVADSVVDWHAEDCGGVTQIVHGFLAGGSHDSPVIFAGMQMGDVVTIGPKREVEEAN